MPDTKESIPVVSGPENEEYLSLGALFLEMVKVIALAIVIIIPIRVFLFQPFFVQGASMEPNFEDGQYLIINEFGYKHTEIPGVGEVIQFRDLDRQDVVVFRYPKNPEQYYIKRIIALPGESVAIKDGIVYIFNDIHHQGYALDESTYLAKNIKTSDMTKITLDEDVFSVFFLVFLL